MSLEDKLALDKFEVDEASHISVDQEICSTCSAKPCLTVCPACVYFQEEGSEKVSVNHLACLECGTCIAACETGGLTWNMPLGGMGIIYRYA